MPNNPDLHPPSDRKRAAARANGTKSKGAKTPEGLARSAMNAVKHGLFAKSPFLLQNESQEIWTALFDSFMLRFQPADDVEKGYVHQLVLIEWRLRRLRVIEAAAIDLKMSEQREQIDRDYNAISEDVRMALAFLASHADIDRFSRYETRLNFQFRRTLSTLLDLQERRPPVQPGTGPSTPETGTSAQNEANALPAESLQATEPAGVPPLPQSFGGYPEYGPRVISRATLPSEPARKAVASAPIQPEVASAVS